MTVEKGLADWPQLVRACVAGSCRLGSPGSTEGGTFSWTVPFMQGAKERGLRVDFIALHWYGDCTKPQG